MKMTKEFKLPSLPFFKKKERQKLEDKETLTFLEKHAIKKALKKAHKQFPKYRKQFDNHLRDKDEIIDKIMELTEVLNIEDEVIVKSKDGKDIVSYVPVTRELLEKKSEEKLLDDLEEALIEAEKLI